MLLQNRSIAALQSARAGSGALHSVFFLKNYHSRSRLGAQGGRQVSQPPQVPPILGAQSRSRQGRRESSRPASLQGKSGRVPLD